MLSTELSNTTFPTCAFDGAASVVSHGQYHFPYLFCKRAWQYHFPYLCWAKPLSLPVLSTELGNTTFPTCVFSGSEQYNFPYLCIRRSCLSRITWAIPLSLPVLLMELTTWAIPLSLPVLSTELGNTTFPTCAVNRAGQYHFPYLCCRWS